jgi:type II secretory pathway pseudopilin PulG
MKKTFKNGFTIIETLVAISILMIAIAGPLTVAGKGYTSAIDARNQSEASLLAQESLEYLNNLKDNKIFPFASWPLISLPITDTCFNLSLLATPAGFDCDYSLSQPSVADNNQIIAAVTVSWSTGLVANSVTLQQVLTNYQR